VKSSYFWIGHYRMKIDGGVKEGWRYIQSLLRKSLLH
jgi:hypothetical protein